MPAQEDRTKGMTLSGSKEALDRFLAKAGAGPHDWVMVRRWEQEGVHAVRLQWPDHPNYRDVGAIVFLVQSARGDGLKISDTEIVETPH